MRLNTLGTVIGTIIGLQIATPARAAEAKNVTWTEFWDILEKQSPKLRALRAKEESVSSRVALEVPAPMIGIGSMGRTSPLSEPMERTYEVTQRVPFPTKFLNAGSVKQAQIDVTQSENALDIQKLKKEATDLFVSLATNLQEQSLFSEKRKVFGAHLKRLRALTLSDQAQQIHILEIDAEEKATDSEIKDLNLKELELRRKLSALLNQEAHFDGTPVFDSLTPPKPKQARVSNPSAVALASKREELADSERSMAKQEWLPDFSITYRKRDRLDGMLPSGQEAMIGVEIPFFWGWQPSSKVGAASANREQMRNEAAMIRRESDSELATLQDRVGILWERLSLYQNEILPLQEKRVHLLHRITPTDMSSLELHLNTLQKWISARLSYLELESEYRKTKASLEILSESPGLRPN